MARGTLLRVVAYVGVLLLAGLLVGALILNWALGSFFGSAPNSHPELQAAIVAAAEQAGEGGTVALAQVYSASWDTVWVWDGYGADTNHEVFPHADFGSGAHGQDYVVAFALTGELVGWVRFNVNDPIVYFDLPTGSIHATRDTAMFHVRSDRDYPAAYVLALR